MSGKLKQAKMMTRCESRGQTETLSLTDAIIQSCWHSKHFSLKI